VVNAPTVISTFAGCGGSSLGYKLAGFKELLAVEWDQNAVDTFRLNFPEVPVYHGDIAKLSGDECMRLAGIGKGELDVFDGSPPCQGFSTAGKRKFDDPRNSLFKEYARLLDELQPKVFVMENVTGMVKGHMKQAYLQIISTLRGCGYRAKGEVLNAMYYGVPQSRERVIIVGVREDLGIEPSHPKPQTRPKTAREAIGGMSDSEIGTVFYPTAPKVKALMGKMRPGDCGTDRGLSSTGFQMLKLHPDRTPGTITKTCTGTWFSGVFHYSDNRYLTIEEVKRLASFPKEHKFIGRFQEQWARIGNSVPPNLMRAIAEHIRDNILTRCEK
jgi:DNA (cytosine-5)-methyltransferase 1